MYYTFLLFISLILWEVTSSLKLELNSSIDRSILGYFNSEPIYKFRKEWEIHRKPLQHAIANALKETAGLAGMNVYVRKTNEPLAEGYLHNDNQVYLILKDLKLEDLPRFRRPEMQFSMAANILKLRTSLSKMIVHCEYTLVRNVSDIIHNPKDQDPYKSSPFLFQQVQDVGRVAISLDDCILTGFIITTLSGESINLGYEHIRLQNCQYNIEIYRPGEDSPPVMATYNPYRNDNGLSIAHLLLKPIGEELLPKLQAAMLSFVNTSSIFGEDLHRFQQTQKMAFRTTALYFTQVVRQLNRITIDRNKEAANIKDLRLHWNDDGFEKPSPGGQGLILKDMVLTGLDTAYSAHIGGPFKLGLVMIGEEIRYSSLQVRGYIEIQSPKSDLYGFAAEIDDMAVDLNVEMSVNKDERVSDTQTLQKKRVYNWTVEVIGLRRMTLTMPSVVFGSTKSMIAGHILIEVPKLLKSHLNELLPCALKPPKKKDLKLKMKPAKRPKPPPPPPKQNPPPPKQSPPPPQQNPSPNKENHSPHHHNHRDDINSDVFDLNEEPVDSNFEKLNHKKAKKRFKNAHQSKNSLNQTNLSKKQRKKKLVADNQILKE